MMIPMRSFAIEKCHDGHVWKEFNVSKFREDATIDPGVNVTFSIEKEGNRQSIATYSVMFYYTPQFKAVHNQAVATYARVGASVPAILHTTRTQLTYS